MEKGKHYKSELKKLLHRAARIEGQVGGIRKMLEEDRNCRQIVTQIAAAKEALAGLGAELLRTELVCRQKENKKVDEKYLRNLFRF